MIEIGWSNSKAQRIVRSHNPPQFENDRNKGYLWIILVGRCGFWTFRSNKSEFAEEGGQVYGRCKNRYY